MSALIISPLIFFANSIDNFVLPLAVGPAMIIFGIFFYHTLIIMKKILIVSSSIDKNIKRKYIKKNFFLH